MQPITTETIDIDGCLVNTIQSSDLSLPTILFLHGKAFQAETWNELGTLQAAVETGFSILALDLPGFGKTTAADITPLTVIKKVLEATALEQVILVGPSMGGKIAIEFSLAHPELVSALVLIGAVGILKNKERLHQLPETTLILWGENDQISDPANGVLLHESVSGSELVIFKGAKHPCYLEQPDIWHQTLLNFAQKTV